jgi:hypothetical protein
MSANDRKLVEALCLAALCSAEALIPESGVSPGAARALARAYRARVRWLVGKDGGV